jgi:hypothetical protein
MKNQLIEEGGSYTYRGLHLYARAEDGTYWASEYQRWMTLAQIDAQLDWCPLCGQPHAAENGQPGYSCEN